MLQNLFTSINSFVLLNSRLSWMSNLTPRWEERVSPLSSEMCPLPLSGDVSVYLHITAARRSQTTRGQQRQHLPLQCFLQHVWLFFLRQGSERKHLSRFQQRFCYFSEGRKTSMCWFCIPENQSVYCCFTLYVRHTFIFWYKQKIAVQYILNLIYFRAPIQCFTSVLRR